MEAGLVEKDNVSGETAQTTNSAASTPLARQLESEKRRREKLKTKRMPKPEHTRIITISNQKGGVGKTTTTVNVSTAMARAGMNVLVIDTDPQGNASTALNIDHHQGVPSIYNVLIEDYDLKDVLSKIRIRMASWWLRQRLIWRAPRSSLFHWSHASSAYPVPWNGTLNTAKKLVFLALIMCSSIAHRV